MQGCLGANANPLTVLLQSGIHGWGLFARKAMKADSMVIEYRGDVLRRSTADARERAYQVRPDQDPSSAPACCPTT